MSYARAEGGAPRECARERQRGMRARYAQRCARERCRRRSGARARARMRERAQRVRGHFRLLRRLSRSARRCFAFSSCFDATLLIRAAAPRRATPLFAASRCLSPYAATLIFRRLFAFDFLLRRDVVCYRYF